MDSPPAPATILTAASLRRLEQAHAADGLMERAGAAAAAWAAELCTQPDRPVLVVAGPGNNGGDALVLARLLRERFFDVRLVLAADPARLPADARAAHARLAGPAPLPSIPDGPFGLVVDGLFGVGLSRPIDGPHADLVRGMNDAAARSACPLLALDCPSGLDGDSGRTLGETVRASHTISFIALKPGLLTGAGPGHCGTLRVDALGLPAAAGDGRTIGDDDVAVALRRRPRDSHKGSFGAPGILGGAAGMLGAALLAGRAALHLGAGRVYLGLLDPRAPGVDPVQPELMLRDATTLFAAPLTALAAGPGLGTDPAVRAALARAVGSPLPLLLDADALNLVAADPALRQDVAARQAPTVLTPHPAEAARLLGVTVGAVQDDRRAAARRLAADLAAWIVLKGAGSLVAAPDGRWWINTSGNPALATAGSGDVLTGMIAALLAQGVEAGVAARCGVLLHGAAADRFAAEQGGETGLAASELIPLARRIANRWTAA